MTCLPDFFDLHFCFIISVSGFLLDIKAFVFTNSQIIQNCLNNILKTFASNKQNFDSIYGFYPSCFSMKDDYTQNSAEVQF